MALQDETQPHDKEELNEKSVVAKEHTRGSRKLLAAAESIPGYLKKMFEIPPNVSIAHTTHVDTTLPLFQARLASGTYEGKLLDGNAESFSWLLVQKLVWQGGSSMHTLPRILLTFYILFY